MGVSREAYLFLLNKHNNKPGADLPEKVAKYHSKKVLINGHCFDSHAEGRRYTELFYCEHAGTIQDFIIQPKFLLQPKFRDNSGKTVRAITYSADFQYTQADGKIIVEDTKGFHTEPSKMRIKMFRSMYPHYVFRLLKYDYKNQEFVEF